MDTAKSTAMNFLAARQRDANDSIVFDIDDTLIKVRGSEPMREMISLYKFAEMIGYKMIIITARPYSDDNAQWTVSQLLEIGINPTRLYFAPPMQKGDVKKALGFKTILSVGDQWTDLTESDKWIKLPDYSDHRILANINKTSNDSHSLNNLQTLS